MNKIKIALCLIVKGTDEEAKLLFRVLQETSQYVDGIFITLTQKNKNAEEVVGSFANTNLSFYKWDNSFANARNYNFSQVPKEYTHILWMDADEIGRAHV